MVSLQCLSLYHGDAANDVSMIQEAHLGVGISGKEGLELIGCSNCTVSIPYKIASVHAGIIVVCQKLYSTLSTRILPSPYQ